MLSANRANCLTVSMVLLATNVSLGDTVEVVGRARDYFDARVGLVSATVIMQVDQQSVSTTSVGDGKFNLAKVPIGDARVRGELPGYWFSTEEITLQPGQRASVEVLGMQDDPMLLASRLVADASRFASSETGFTAAWATLSWYGVPPEAKVVTCAQMIELDRAAANLPVIRGYAEVDRQLAATETHRFGDFLLNPAQGFPLANRPLLPNAVSADIARHTLRKLVQPRFETEPLPKLASEDFLREFSQQWGGPSPPMTSASFAAENVIRRVRHSRWESAYTRDNASINHQLSLWGERGFYRLEGGDIGQLTGIRYFLRQNSVEVWGAWRLGNNTGWFQWKVNPLEPERFSGQWGLGARLGAGPALGTWTGRRIED